MTKKIYTVRINDVVRFKVGQWYNRNKGQIFDCYLKASNRLDINGDPYVVFAVDTLHSINPLHCTVIGERVE